MVLHGEPIYEENDVERANPVGMRYYYTTNDVIIVKIAGLLSIGLMLLHLKV